jgi:hypothetical protein
MHTERPEGPALSRQRPPVLARAASAQVKLADPVYPVPRAGRGPAPITCLVHPLPPAGPLPGPGTQSAALYRLLTTSHLLPRPGRLRGHGRHRPGVRVSSASSGAQACYAGASSQSPSIRSGRFPCQIQVGPALTWGPRARTAGTTAKCTLTANEPRHRRQGGRHHRGRSDIRELARSSADRRLSLDNHAKQPNAGKRAHLVGGT